MPFLRKLNFLRSYNIYIYIYIYIYCVCVCVLMFGSLVLVDSKSSWFIFEQGVAWKI